MNKIRYPKLEKPHFIKDGVTWLKVFHARADLIEAPFFGVNIWRVKRRNFTSSLIHMLKLGRLGLDNSYGKVHYLESFEIENKDLLTVVLIYDWFNLPKVIPGLPPIGILPAHFRFMRLIEAYNWSLFKELEPDLSTYSKMTFDRFHEDICFDL